MNLEFIQIRADEKYIGKNNHIKIELKNGQIMTWKTSTKWPVLRFLSRLGCFKDKDQQFALTDKEVKELFWYFENITDID